MTETPTPRAPIWKSIAETLEAEIAKGLYPPASRLPTEARLSARFGVNRHTVRRALGDMADRGIVRSRRGAGVFVEAPPTDYPLGRRVRFHQSIRASGRLPEKRVLRVETRPGSPEETEALGLAPLDPVIVYEGVSLAGGMPIAHFESAFPARRFPGLTTTLETTASVTEALRQNGVPDYVRAETRITAVAASATQAAMLNVRDGAPLIFSRAINTDLGGTPIERGSTWFVGDRVTLTVSPEQATGSDPEN